VGKEERQNWCLAEEWGQVKAVQGEHQNLKKSDTELCIAPEGVPIQNGGRKKGHGDANPNQTTRSRMMRTKGVGAKDLRGMEKWTNRLCKMN